MSIREERRAKAAEKVNQYAETIIKAALVLEEKKATQGAFYVEVIRHVQGMKKKCPQEIMLIERALVQANDALTVIQQRLSPIPAAPAGKQTKAA